MGDIRDRGNSSSISQTGAGQRHANVEACRATAGDACSHSGDAIGHLQASGEFAREAKATGVRTPPS